MSTWPQYIAAMELANRNLFKAERIQMTPQSFREQLRLAYFAGLDCAEAEMKRTAGEMPEFMKGIFK